jgi:hypothetical protein
MFTKGNVAKLMFSSPVETSPPIHFPICETVQSGP